MEISANFIKIVFGVLSASIGSSAAFLIGEWSQLHTILAVMMSLDIVTGLMKGVYNKKLDSKVGYKGLMRKGGIIVVLIIANMADLIMGNETPVFVVAITFFYIAIEALSLIENLEQMGVPMPQKLKDLFFQMRVENEEKSEEKDLYFQDKVTVVDAVQEATYSDVTSEKSEK